ncbi:MULTISPECIES: hypothetical protein [unclassified Paenibacillus]|uniref:hypothetical protein n=1 Tax=unclassified Paenibacillus TaxID=185978 RepID=UPI0011815C79|nr:hypothetical protein [Paenibacillus sp. FSL H8-0259]
MVDSVTGTLPTSITHSRQSVTPGDINGASNYYRIAVNGAGSGFGANDVYYLQQQIENGVRLLCGLGKKITVSFWARSSIASKKIGVRLNQFIISVVRHLRRL